MGGLAGHWDDAYRARGLEGVSWFQSTPALSLELVRLLEVGPTTAVIDIGAGASSLVDCLLKEGFTDLSVLDISGAALQSVKERLGPDATVTWLHEDVLTWRPARHFGLWHDRALFHFLTAEEQRAQYLTTLSAATRPGAALIMATFADDGPEYCSGFPVARYSPRELVRALGSDFVQVAERRELHITPAGVAQPFNWIAARRQR